MNEPFSIRRAEQRDVPGILYLLEQVDMVHHRIRPDLFKGPAVKYGPKELSDLLSDDESPVFVCVNALDQVLGHCFCCMQRHEAHAILTDVKTLYIDDLCVDEAFRGRHIGKALYDFVIEYAKAHGCYNVTLNVWAGNDDALRFYQRQGMKPQKFGMEIIL